MNDDPDEDPGDFTYDGLELFERESDEEDSQISSKDTMIFSDHERGNYGIAITIPTTVSGEPPAPQDEYRVADSFACGGTFAGDDREQSAHNLSTETLTLFAKDKPDESGNAYLLTGSQQHGDPSLGPNIDPNLDMEKMLKESMEDAEQDVQPYAVCQRTHHHDDGGVPDFPGTTVADEWSLRDNLVPASMFPIEWLSSGQPDTPYSCHWCEATFNSAISLKAHQWDIHESPEAEKIHCNYQGCEHEIRHHKVYKTEDVKDYKRHYNGHTGEFKWLCSPCQRSFTRKDNGRRHINKPCKNWPSVLEERRCKIYPWSSVGQDWSQWENAD